ncbi:MAG: hypothetical protein RL398_2301 [Planctomycetota bacterium]
MSAERRSAWWQGPLVAVAAAAVFLAIGAGRFYKTDGTDIVRLLDDHLQGVPGAVWPHPWHVGYLPALAGFLDVVQALGLRCDFVALGEWFSALGAAIGLGFCHAAFVRLAPAGRAWAATLLTAAAPTVLLFASVVEFHGPVLAPLGACLWWTARQIERPSMLGMVVLAGLCHVAFLIHGQAMFAPLWLLALFLVRRDALQNPRELRFVAVLGLLHVGLWFALPRLLPSHYGFWGDLSRGLAAEGSIGRPQSLDYLPSIVWQEWLRPLLPLSLAPLAAFCVRGLRQQAVAFWLGAAPFLYVSVRQLVFEPEFGAYLLPMIPGAALLAASLPLPRKALLLLVLLGIANRVTLSPFEALEPVDDLAVAVERVAGDRVPFVLIGSHRELTVVYETLGILPRRRDPLTGERFLWVRAQASAPADKFTIEQAVGVEQFLKVLAARGRAVLITKTALASLDDPRAAMLAEKASLDVPSNEQMAGPRYAAHLRAKFELRGTASELLLELVPR